MTGLHSLRNIPRNIVAIHARDPRKRRVNPGRHAARRPNITVDRPSRMRDPVRSWISRNDTRPRGLVSRRAYARQQPRSRNDHRAGAHRDQILKLGISLLNEIQRSFEIGIRSARAGAARDEQDFEVGGRGGEGVRGRDADEGAGVELVHRGHSRAGGYWVHGLRKEGDVDFGGAGEGEEGFVGAPDVEGFVGWKMPHLFGGLVLFVALLPTPVGCEFGVGGKLGLGFLSVAYSTREGSLYMWCCRRRMLRSGMLPGSTKQMNAFWMKSMSASGLQCVSIDL